MYILKNKQTNKQVMKLIAGIFVTLFLIVTSKAQTCTQIQGCDVTISDRCYAYVDDNLNWNQAENCCVAWGGHLASIHSDDTNTILSSIRNPNRWNWIGLSNTANDSEYAWSDGTPFDYNNSNSDQPGNNGEVCFHYLSEEPYWNYYDCNRDTYVVQGGISYPISYICQKMVSESQFCTPIQRCDVTINGSCYSHVDDSLNWNQAENCCIAWGGHLASIHSDDTNILLNSIRNQNRLTWIGLSDTANVSVYVWTDGTQYDYKNFAPNEPNSHNGESCFHFIFDGALTWNDNDCGSGTFESILTSYICQKWQFTGVCENRVISDVNVTGGICYEEFSATDMSDWNSALNSCSGILNRRLARVLNEEMSTEIERITQDTDEYWIGLSRPASNSEFMWSDGTSVSYTRWCSGHPMDGLNCVSVRRNSTEWYSRNCDDVKHYVCETDVCVGWTVKNGICYQRFDTTIDADAAISFCQSHNAYLAEIPNIYVDNVITEIIGDFGGGNTHWIGLRTNDTHYYWRLGDFSLGNDRPSFSDSDCGAVNGNDGNRWIIRDCDNMRRTICMIDVCEDWTVRNGICYKKFDTNTSWTDSVEFCRNETAFLAEIPNIFINDIISSLISSNEECYIGLYGDSTGLAWRIGEFAVTESNSNSVTATSADIRYGTMHRSGRWNLGDGDTDRCVVCMRGNPSPQSFSNYQCNKVADSTVNDTVYDSSCYRRLETTTANLDIITYRCQNYVNGELYAFDNPDLNNILLERFETDTFLIQSRNQYTGFIPPNNSFNLLATNETYNFSEFECEIVSKDGPINTYTPPEGETCEGSSRIYFCKTDYTPHFNISKEITFNETLYQLIADNRNFGEARDYCNNRKGTNDMNGHLMEILNQQQQQQQQVLLNLTSTVNQYVDEYYWIGLEYNNFDYVWTSGNVANYIVNITNLTDTDSYCVAVDRDGKWLGLDCSDRYSFICQIPHVPPTAVTNATNMSTSTATSMIPNMSTSTATSMMAIMSTSTPTSMTTNMSTSAPTMNAGIDCLQNTATAVCATLLDLTYDPTMGMDPFIQIEMSLEMLSNSTTIGTGQIVRGFNENLQAEILVANVDSNTSRTFVFDNVTMKINDQSFDNNTIVISAVYASTNYANIASKVITVIASVKLAGNLTMIFSLINQTEGTTLMCSSYTNNSQWSSDGITKEEMESTIECTTNHLTTFAVTQVIKVTISDTVNCSKQDSKNTSFCDILEVIVQISTQQKLISTPQSQSNNTAVQSLQEVDDYLESILLLYNVTTGVKLVIVQPQQVLVIIGIRQNETTSVSVGENVVTANPDSFPDDTVLVVLSTSFNDTIVYTNLFYSQRIVSDIITMKASNELEGNLTIKFTLIKELRNYNNNYYCLFHESGILLIDGNAQITNRQCITTHLSVNALLSISYTCYLDTHTTVFLAMRYTLWSVSLLFLIATIIAFLYSWKQVFRIDINILNFNYSIVLSLAILVSIIGQDLASKNRYVCHVSAFLSHFLWTSVFLSTLSITILVFHSIWIVGIKHQPRKLSPYLIPISWTISGIWALIWLAVGLAKNMYIDSDIIGYDNTECPELCELSTEVNLIYAFIVPIIVIIIINLVILILNLLKIRKVFKNSDRKEIEIVRLRKVAFGGFLLVPSLGLPFLLWIPLVLTPFYLYENHGIEFLKYISESYYDSYVFYIILVWLSMIATGTIGITHFVLVTYQTPEVRPPKLFRCNRGGKVSTFQTSSSNSRIPRQAPVLKFNVVKKPKIDCIVIENENTETKV